MTESCSNCRFYKPMERQDNLVVGQCRKEPPSTMHPSPTLLTMWPLVQAQDWCGAHKPSEPHDPMFVSIPTRDYEALRRALAPVLLIAERVAEVSDSGGADNLVMLDLADGEGKAMGLAVAEFQELADVWAAVEGKDDDEDAGGE